MKTGRLLIGTLVGLLVLLAWVFPDLQRKVGQQKADKEIALAWDWEDVSVFNVDLKSIPVSLIVLSPTNTVSDENKIRSARLRILWRIDDGIRPAEWVSRYKKGDGIFIVGEHALEHPQLVRDLPNLIRDQDGFLSLMEFVPNPLLPILSRRLTGNLIKSHMLSTREMMTPKPALWEKRLLRAAEERWARLLLVRFSPAWTLEKNIEFQKKLLITLEEHGFTVGTPRPFQSWATVGYSKLRLKLVLLISILLPLIVLLWADRSTWPPFIIFLLGSFTSVLAGVLIHGLGSSPSSVLGIDVMRGVKLQLALPLILAALILIRPIEWRKFLDIQLRVKHVVVAGLGLFVLLTIYLMRSGNFPLIPVSDAERGLRNWLDTVLVARPRFKEFMIGHPFFLIGLILKRRGINFDLFARCLLWIGIIGQVSILNTFTHFHSPLDLGIIRSINGLLFGVIVASPVLVLLHLKK